jgi:tetratricopeptide (TPR) repeat protein/predicted aspartyl protease
MISRRHALWFAAAMLPAVPASATCSASSIGTLAVTMEGLRPIVPATLNGTEVKFLADSGAAYSLISPSVAAQLALRLEPTPSNFQLRGIGGGASASITKVKSFGIAGATVPDVTFLVGGSDTGRAGLIGQNVLGLFDTDYDLAGGVIRLIKTKDCGKTSLAYWAGDKPVQEVPLIMADARNPHTTAYVLINGVKMRATFDTGASTSMLTLKAAARAGVKPGDPDTRPAGMTGGLGRAMTQSWIGPFQSFALGGEQILKTHLRFADVPDAPFDMLLGADFFLSHHIFVSKTTGRMFLTYNGGPVFNLTTGYTPPAHAAPAADETATAATDLAAPKTADDFARRGAAFAARRDFAHAFPDLTHAIEMAPTEPSHLVTRANAYLANRQPLLAKTDLDAALRLKPDDADALMARAILYMVTDHRPDAIADLDAAARAAPKQANLRLDLAKLYSRAEAYEPAVGEFDLWLAVHDRNDRNAPEAYNGRCWARAMTGRDLAKAQDDCNAALRLMPRTATYLDSRGLVRLRLGDLDKAIADYDAALAIQPKIAWSLYGRGIARQRKGLKAEGDADIAAALAIDPRIAQRAARFGVS